MSEFDPIVEKIRGLLAAAPSGTPANRVEIPYEQLSLEIASIIGTAELDSFFENTQPAEFSGATHLIGLLFRLIDRCIAATETGIAFDEARFVARLEMVAECVRKGQMDFQFTLRLTNVDIPHDFDLADGIHFVKRSREYIAAQYPMERVPSYPLSEMYLEHWPQHGVEVIISGSGRPSDFQEACHVNEHHAMIGEIVYSFILSGICDDPPPFVTHTLCDSPIESSYMYLGEGDFKFTPYLLSEEEIGRLQQTISFLRVSGGDSVMRTAIDRFILACKRQTHHPNQINEPHWDKLVDFVIAMETLFLTTNGGAMEDELSYRFRLNGSQLISRATGEDM